MDIRYTSKEFHNCVPPVPPTQMAETSQSSYFINPYTEEANLTHSMRQNPSSVANIQSGNHEVHRLLRHLIKGKGKVVTVYVMKPYRGRRGTVPLILNLCTRWGSGVKTTPGRSTPGKEKDPLNNRLRQPTSRPKRFGEDKNVLPLTGFESRTVQSVAYYRLHGP